MGPTLDLRIKPLNVKISMIQTEPKVMAVEHDSSAR